MPGPKILICGASIAGPTLAHWLLKGVEAEITIIERSSALRTFGQSIDIRNAAIDVMRKMGIEEQVIEKTTKEAGIQLVDSKGRTQATIESTGDGESSFTAEYELFRGDLSKIIWDTIDHSRIKTIFGDYVTMIRQEPDGVFAEFANGTESQTFDLIVGADGLGSKTRAMAWNTTSRAHIKRMNFYLSFFTMPEDLLKGSQLAQWYNAPGGRIVLLRPDPTRVTRANFGVIYPQTPEGRAKFDALLAAEKRGQAALKDHLANIMRGAGFEADKVIKGMYEADDFYSSEIAQVHTDELYKGRVVLLGDSAYCPSPMSGMGTSLAMIGSYILAGEIAKTPNDIPAALKAYEDIMLPFAHKSQELPFGFPYTANPQSQWGINVRNWIVWAITTFKIDTVFSKLGAFISVGAEKLDLPAYPFRDQAKTG